MRSRDEIIAAVRTELPAKRWEHTLGVMDTAARLARQYGADPVKADLAAILHDVAKYWSLDRLEQSIKSIPVPEPFHPDIVLAYDRQLLHAPIGAYIAETEYGIHDQEVLDAIRYHTSGRERMTLLDKIVCLADYMEPGRDFPGVHEIRDLADINLERALIAGFDSTIQFLITKGKTIFPLTIVARNSLIQEGFH